MSNELTIYTVDALVKEFPTLDEPIIDGLLRRGETANIIAPSKTGKSWLTYNLALCIATGGKLFEQFDCACGRVLVVDNELRKPTLAKRLPAVAEALGIKPKDYAGYLDVLPLRGKSVSLAELCSMLTDFPAGEYDCIIADAFYRFLPERTNENDNAQMMALYNLIDTTTSHLEAAWVNVHHSSKGAQGEKAVTDVGSGAGSMSRAADAHIVMRPHEEDGVFVLEAAIRSFAPVEPLALRWDYPLWAPASGVDPAKLKGKLTKQEQRQGIRDREGCDALLRVLRQEQSTIRNLRTKTGLSRERCERLLGDLKARGEVDYTPTSIKGNECLIYHVGDYRPPT